MFFHKKKKLSIGIDGMHCSHCANKVDKALEDISFVSSVKVSLKDKSAIVYYEDNADFLLLQKTIEELGYIVTGIKEIH